MCKRSCWVFHSEKIQVYASFARKRSSFVLFFDWLNLASLYQDFCLKKVENKCTPSRLVGPDGVGLCSIHKAKYLGHSIAIISSIQDGLSRHRVLVSVKDIFIKKIKLVVVVLEVATTRVLTKELASSLVQLKFQQHYQGHEPEKWKMSTMQSLGTSLGPSIVGLGLVSCVLPLEGVAKMKAGFMDMLQKLLGGLDIQSARMVFDKMQHKNLFTLTSLLSACVESGLASDEAIKLFCNMLHGHVTPNCFTFSSVLKACASLPDFGIGKQLHGQTIKLGLSTINCVGNSLINMYARSGTMECARKAFNILFEKNLISYNTAADANAKALDSDESFNHEVEHTGVGASPFTYACLLSGAACIGTIVKGEQIHALIVKSGFGTNLCINNALISMYSKCGNKEAALQVFNDMGYRNVITWTSIISGFAKHGFATKALELFYEMLEIGVKPNEVTYIAVLSACSHVGLIDEAWKHFNSMHYNHSISPRMEHYACMVDLLGRSGLLLEAIEFINSMPFDADALVWRTFLGSCRVHRNTKLGEHAAKKILEREPHDPATYILLSNLYASEGRWDDVAALRKSMKQKKLIKETGYSWIEVDNQVHKFHVGDTSHPQARKIYDELDELALKIKNLGYIPNTDFVLHDVEDEQKEQYLFQHSEKIAVAYALISTPKPKPIRVFKNLRVCGDCHTAIKYISIVTGREIVVRDANRFHHIKDGKCSCNDYW
ncbi:hypothetical protein JHK87_040904 [Glycine soja]|nr:hypothetical protein JHK87_040904 [Glycine soja]